MYILLEKFSTQKKPIYLEDIEVLKKDKESYNTIRYSFKELVEESSSEWVNDGFVNTKQVVCDLCGSTSLKFNFKIKNLKNKNEMIVGSSCIEKFPKINQRNINIKEHKNKASRIYRSNILNDMYPDIKKIMNEWTNFYKSFPILLNEDINLKFINLIKNSSEFYQNYIDAKIAQKKASEFQQYIDEFTSLKQDAIYFLNKNKDNIYVCDKKIENWINSNVKNRDRLIQLIRKNDGMIDENTSKYIYQLDFIKRFEKDIEYNFNKFGFNVFLISQENGIIIETKVGRNNFLKLSIKLSEFMDKFNYFCFNIDNEQISREYIISNFKIYMNSENINNLVEEINYFLYETKYYVEEDGRYLKFYRSNKKDREEKYNKYNRSYAKIDLNLFFDLIKDKLLNDYKGTRKIILDKISQFQRWINEEEILEAMRNKKSLM